MNSAPSSSAIKGYYHFVKEADTKYNITGCKIENNKFIDFKQDTLSDSIETLQKIFNPNSQLEPEKSNDDHSTPITHQNIEIEGENKK